MPIKRWSKRLPSKHNVYPEGQRPEGYPRSPRPRIFTLGRALTLCLLAAAVFFSGTTISIFILPGQSHQIIPQHHDNTAEMTSESPIAPPSLPTGPFVGPGDLVPGATAYYGLRGYTAEYAASGTNPAIKIRRVSDDAVADIAILSTGELDVEAAQKFCGNTNCTVVEWYDQTGNGHNIYQNSVPQQPELLLNGFGGKPLVEFNYNRMTYLSGSFAWVSGNEPWTGQAALLNVAMSGWYEPIFDYGAVDVTNEDLFALAENGRVSPDLSVAVAGTDVLSGVETTAPEALSFYSTGSSLGGVANGVGWSQAFSASDIQDTVFVMGGSPNQEGIWLTGGVGEVVLYASALSRDDIDKLASSERQYYGF